MKMSKIGKICKEKGIIVTHIVSDDEQWINTGGAIYLVRNFPQLAKAAACDLLDIEPKKREGIKYKIEYDLPMGISLEDNLPGESASEAMPFGIEYRGKTFSVIYADDGAIFIDDKNLSPFKDADGMMRLYVRRTPQGAPYIAVKIGLELHAVVMPYDLAKKDFVEMMREFISQCQNRRFNNGYKKEADNHNQGNQTSL